MKEVPYNEEEVYYHYGCYDDELPFEVVDELIDKVEKLGGDENVCK